MAKEKNNEDGKGKDPTPAQDNAQGNSTWEAVDTKAYVKAPPGRHSQN